MAQRKAIKLASLITTPVFNDSLWLKTLFQPSKWWTESMTNTMWQLIKWHLKCSGMPIIVSLCYWEQKNRDLAVFGKHRGAALSNDASANTTQLGCQCLDFLKQHISRAIFHFIWSGQQSNRHVENFNGAHDRLRRRNTSWPLYSL